MPLHSITYTEAKQFILDFLLKVTGAGNALGGTIKKNALVITNAGSTNPGLIGWYCFNYNNSGNYPSFFMAFESSNVEYNIEIPPVNCFNELLAYSESFTYAGDNSLTAIDSFLHEQQHIPGDPQEITDNTTEDFKQLFLDKFPEGNSNPFNEDSCAFFKRDEITDFLNQSSGSYPYVRYVFGYDNSAAGQKIRLILFPVDSNGNNVVDNCMLLQHSWPPYNGN